MEYEWYADVFFVINFLMDSAGLLAAGICCNRKIRFAKLVFVCAATVVISMILLVVIPFYLIYCLIIHIVLNPLMTVLVFQPKGWGDFFRMLLMVYLVLFVVGGVQESLRLQTGMDSYGQILFCGIITSVLFVVWQIRQKVIQYVCAVDLWFEGQRISVAAYCDSGNLLRDPDCGNAVSILDGNVLPCEWKDKLMQKKKIPYHTVNGMETYIDVITLDKMDIYLKGTVKQIQTPEIGLLAEKIMRKPEVQMLLHGSYIG